MLLKTQAANIPLTLLQELSSWWCVEAHYPLNSFRINVVQLPLTLKKINLESGSAEKWKIIDQLNSAVLVMKPYLWHSIKAEDESLFSIIDLDCKLSL